VKVIFSSSKLWGAFCALTRAAQFHVPPQMVRRGQESSAGSASGILALAEAAVRFTIQFSVEVAVIDAAAAANLECSMIAELSGWSDERGDFLLRLWTHDLCCAIDALSMAARRHALPRDARVEDVEDRWKSLAIAAVAFVIQLAIEATAIPAWKLRDAKRRLNADLETPWEPFRVPSCVEAQDSPSWGPLSDEET